MRVLITGAAGFIGSHLADRLVDEHELFGLDNSLTGDGRNFPTRPPSSRIWNLDITDRSALYSVSNNIKPDLVIHCAASYSDPTRWHRDTDTNVGGTINVINVARHHGARLVYFQTALPPISSYAISKIAGEQYIRLATDVPSLIFRLANIYGPRNLSGPIPTFYKRLSNGETCTVTDTARDTVYIDDFVDLVMRGIDQNATGKYDVCSGTHYPIERLYRAVAAAVPHTPEFDEPNRISRTADDVANMDLDPQPALDAFDWRASTSLEHGVYKAVEWYREHGVGDTYTHLALKG